MSQIETIYPRRIEDEVYVCGFTSPKSYGANSYLIRDPEGNWLTDSPRFEPRLVARLQELGGVRWIFLTHRDDVADAELYARHFRARRLIHEAEVRACPGAEQVLRGCGPWSPAPGFKIIATPGHTAGHCVLLHKDRFLFTGDHLEGAPPAERFE